VTNQDNQNQIKSNTTAPKTYKKNKLAFVGCENCSVNCCEGTKFNRASVLLNDLYDVAKLFPVVFKQTDDGEKIEMRFIFSLKRGTPCPYLDSDSKKCTIWDSVRPRACRSYPLIMESIKPTEDSKTHFSIIIDTKFCEAVKESDEGIKIVTDDGKISEEILDKFFGREALANYEKDISATNKFLDLVNELDLFVGAEIILGKKPLPAGGFKDDVLPILIISRQKLAALDADSVKRLQTAGYVNVINAHLESLSHFHRLRQAVMTFEKTRQSINMLDFTFGS
jgi:Fe-S-cluster containining protein